MTDVLEDLYNREAVVADPESREAFRLVDRPPFNPGYCAVTLRSDDPEGFIDTGNDLRVAGPRIYVSIGGLRRMIRFAGIVDPEVAELRMALDEANARVLELEHDVDEADKNMQAVDRLVRTGYSKQRKPGRKTGDKTVANNLPGRSSE